MAARQVTLRIHCPEETGFKPPVVTISATEHKIHWGEVTTIQVDIEEGDVEILAHTPSVEGIPSLHASHTLTSKEAESRKLEYGRRWFWFRWAPDWLCYSGYLIEIEE